MVTPQPGDATGMTAMSQSQGLGGAGLAGRPRRRQRHRRDPRAERRVEVVDRGSYLRVWCPRRCRVTRAALERHRGAPFKLPVDLESVMSSFKGRLSMSEEEACWDA